MSSDYTKFDKKGSIKAVTFYLKEKFNGSITDISDKSVTFNNDKVATDAFVMINDSTNHYGLDTTLKDNQILFP